MLTVNKVLEELRQPDTARKDAKADNVAFAAHTKALRYVKEFKAQNMTVASITGKKGSEKETATQNQGITRAPITRIPH